MQSATDAIASMQEQALEAIKSGQSVTLEAVKNWSDAVAKVVPDSAPSAPSMPSELKSAIGDPKEIIDSVYDFATKLLELNKKFVHDLLEASTPEK